MCSCVVCFGACCLASVFVVIRVCSLFGGIFAIGRIVFVDQWGVFVRGMYLYGVMCCLCVRLFVVFGGMRCSAVMFCLWGLFCALYLFCNVSLAVLFVWLYV